MTLKKAELHVHLEGSITPTQLRQLAQRNRLIIPDGLICSDDQSYLSRDFLHFLQVYDVVADFIKTPRDYYDITFDYLRANALSGAIYTELMYSPDHAEKATGIPSIEHLYAIQQAIDDAEQQFQIIGRVIITAVRHFGAEAAVRVANNALKESVPCVTGFGLGGDELNYPPKLFKKAYDIARAGGLYCTVHAGEFAPASGMVEAMEYLPIQRIGHGVQIIHCAETIAMVKDRQIALEVCPSSNIFLGLFESLATHPFPKLLDAKIPISISSDDPPFMRTTLAQEYERVQQAYGYSDEIMNEITATAIEFAFVDDQTKQQLKARLAS